MIIIKQKKNRNKRLKLNLMLMFNQKIIYFMIFYENQIYATISNGGDVGNLDDRTSHPPSVITRVCSN